MRKLSNDTMQRLLQFFETNPVLANTLLGAGLGGVTGGVMHLALPGKEHDPYGARSIGNSALVGAGIGGIHGVWDRRLPDPPKLNVNLLPGKLSMSRNLQAVPVGAGPDQMVYALNMLNQARTLVNPSDQLLQAKGVKRPAFERHLQTIADRSQGQDRFNLSSIAPNPNTHAAVAGGVGGLGAAALLNKTHGLPAAIVGGLGVGGLSALVAKLRAQKQRREIGSTARVLKEYGVLNPEMLRQVRPLLMR